MTREPPHAKSPAHQAAPTPGTPEGPEDWVIGWKGQRSADAGLSIRESLAQWNVPVVRARPDGQTVVVRLTAAEAASLGVLVPEWAIARHAADGPRG